MIASGLFRVLTIAFVSFLFASTSFAGRDGEQGVCMDGSRRIESYNNAQVLNWKTSTPNTWQGRGFVNGSVVEVVKDRSSHLHFVIKIGPAKTDILEVIYNVSFGQLPALNPGTPVAICGDYITANDRSGRYPPSPAGAIIHWVHGSNNNRHEDGFVAVNGTVYGQEGDARRGGGRGR